MRDDATGWQPHAEEPMRLAHPTQTALDYPALLLQSLQIRHEIHQPQIGIRFVTAN
jgi:hypothetical protein